MTSRRHFLSTAAAAAGALSVAPHAWGSPLPSRRSGSPLRILVLGGTGFLGPHLIHVATQRGHRVSMLNRGQREPGLFEEDYRDVEQIVGDRAAADGLEGLKGRSWDVVIETSGYQHPWTAASTQALKDSVDRYMYVSSTGVFLPYHTVDIDEDGTVLLTDNPPQDPPSYGVMKALSERAVRNAFGAKAIIVRPGYIVGPGDTTDRFTYWPVRVARGGDIMVPGKKSDPVQYIDVRDLSEWMIRVLEDGTTGTFNAVGPARRQTMEEFIYGLGATTALPLTWTWIEDYDFLRSYPLRQGPDGQSYGLVYAVPWLIPEGDHLGHMQIDGRRAIAAGLTFRPLAITAMDIVAWRNSDAAPQALRDQPRYVLTPDQEAAMLAAWRRRE